jgi:hypothetical protein
MLFRSKSKESANGVGVELEDYAMVRYLCEVDESHFHAHGRQSVRSHFDTKWGKVEIMGDAGYKLMKWDILENDGFQYGPHTQGWGVHPCKTISHRVIMQPVMLKDMTGFFWLNEEFYNE